MGWGKSEELHFIKVNLLKHLEVMLPIQEPGGRRIQPKLLFREAWFSLRGLYRFPGRGVPVFLFVCLE